MKSGSPIRPGRGATRISTRCRSRPSRAGHDDRSARSDRGTARGRSGGRAGPDGWPGRAERRRRPPSPARRRLPIALYPALLAATLVVELFNVSGASPFAAVGRCSWPSARRCSSRGSAGCSWATAIAAASSRRSGSSRSSAARTSASGGSSCSRPASCSRSATCCRQPSGPSAGLGSAGVASRLTVVFDDRDRHPGYPDWGRPHGVARAITQETALRPATTDGRVEFDRPGHLHGPARWSRSGRRLSSVFGQDGSSPSSGASRRTASPSRRSSRSNYTQTGETLTLDVQPGAPQGHPADGRPARRHARTNRPAGSCATSSTTTRPGRSCATAVTRSTPSRRASSRSRSARPIGTSTRGSSTNSRSRS